MTPPNLTGSALAAWHRSEAYRIEAEERARRPALAAGQVWVRKGEHYIVARHHRDESDNWVLHGVDLGDGNIWNDRIPGFSGMSDEFEYVGLARDVLRVVPPDPPAPQVAPEPTGAELVGRRCWVRDAAFKRWEGPHEVLQYDGSSMLYLVRFEDYTQEWYREAKPYVEGVAP